MYICLSLFAPKNSFNSPFKLTQLQIFLIQFTVTVPYIITWFLAIYGLSTLADYLEVQKDNHSNIHILLRSFLKGLSWIIMGTILVTLIGGVKQYFTSNSSILPLFTIVTNYLYVFPLLLGFITMYLSVRQLRTSEEIPNSKRSGYELNTIIVVLLGSFYLFFLSTNTSRQFSTLPLLPPTYYLPDWAILLTLVIPILVTWWLGFFIAFTISDIIPYFTQPELFKGVTRIVYGIWSIIFTSIILQGLLSLGSTKLYSAGLIAILSVIYIFIIIQGLGYFSIALGCTDLRKSLTDNTLTEQL